MFALYIHWPFCQAKCPYCDFNSHIRTHIDQAKMRDALLEDMRQIYEITGRQKLRSLFFGGGTPSLMPPQTVAAIIEQASQFWEMQDNIEITLEANPNSSETQNFQDLAQAGVNRLSLGIQALRQDALVFLGRNHDVKQAEQAISLAQRFFSRVNIDLIYTRPNQTLQAWQAELKQALTMAGDHFSLYQLTLEEGTAFYTRHRLGEFTLPDTEQSATLYQWTNDFMAARGRPAYEISNYAQSGCESQHNLAYWRYEDYGGIGPGAHGRLTIDGKRHATYRHRLPENWLKAVSEKGHGQQDITPLSSEICQREAIMMGLRLRDGIVIADFETKFSQHLEAVLSPKKLNDLCDANYLSKSTTHLACTQQGWVKLNAILDYLLN